MPLFTVYMANPVLARALVPLVPPDLIFTDDEPAADWSWPDPSLPRRRLGAWLDDLTARANQRTTLPTAAIPLGPGTLDPRTRIYHGVTPPVTLTAREVALILALTQAEGRTLSKDIILRDVWDYRSDLETHTLETHIYRLRQKIEGDPRAPKILITVPNGYALGGS
jgi:DNA-binding response OmpR family regulator